MIKKTSYLEFNNLKPFGREEDTVENICHMAGCKIIF
jgi:hypothetical protein